MAENFIRSANAPTMRAGVMIANVSWNIWNTDSGIVPDTVSTPTPERKNLPTPTNALRLPPSPKARPYPYTVQMRVTMQVMTKHCIMTDRTFLARTRPA